MRYFGYKAHNLSFVLMQITILKTISCHLFINDLLLFHKNISLHYTDIWMMF